jgi:hypothetical protein
MQYLLVTTNGKHMEFHTKGAAELFKEMYGGYVLRISDELKLAA